MIRQNIKVALFVILGLITFWLIIFSFIKLDVTTHGLISHNDSYYILTIDDNSAAYIENNAIDYIKMEYEKKYRSCHISFSSTQEGYCNYLISLPEDVDVFDYLDANIIIDSLNVYQYLLKK